MRYQTVGTQVLFKASLNKSCREVAVAGHPDWARRIARALNDTDPMPEGEWPSTRKTLWVAEDGSFGSDNVVIIDTSDWTEQQRKAVQEASASERLKLALTIHRDIALESEINADR